MFKKIFTLCFWLGHETHLDKPITNNNYYRYFVKCERCKIKIKKRIRRVIPRLFWRGKKDSPIDYIVY
jgi:hypothetical protein